MPWPGRLRREIAKALPKIGSRVFSMHPAARRVGARLDFEASHFGQLADIDYHKT
jgi:hypothetical protein